MTATQAAIYTWHPVDGAAVTVSLYRHPGLANQVRCLVAGKVIGCVWQRSVGGFHLVWSYRFENDTLGIVRGSCRDRAEAVGRLMFDARDRGLLVAVAVATSAATAAAGLVADGATK